MTTGKIIAVSGAGRKTSDEGTEGTEKFKESEARLALSEVEGSQESE